MMKRGIVTTFSGHHLDVLRPDPSCIEILDIATGLSRACRYAGQCKFFYSVAQHCITGSYFCAPGDRLAFLLHDAPEAYMCDLVHNVKECLPVYKNIEVNLRAVICNKFGVSQEIDWDEIKRVDNAVMAAEAKILVRNTSGWYFPEEPINTTDIKHESMNRVRDKYLQLFGAYKVLQDHVEA